MSDTPKTIGNPLSWAAGAALGTGEAIGKAATSLGPAEPAEPIIRQIGLGDIRTALTKGLDDFTALRSDVLFLVALYPIIGIAMAVISLDRTLMPMFFPLAAGFAILGPLAAIGLYEMSRLREMGADHGWGAALRVLSASALTPVLVLGAYLMALFLLWMIAAFEIWQSTLGPVPPISVAAFVSDIVSTGAGWTMAITGTAVGFVFAALALVVSIVSFPMLLDRRVGVVVAVVTSIRVARRNPATVITWGGIVAGGLALGSLPLFLGLIFVLPVLGHATWHLYRAAIDWDDS